MSWTLGHQLFLNASFLLDYRVGLALFTGLRTEILLSSCFERISTTLGNRVLSRQQVNSGPSRHGGGAENKK